MLPLPVGLVAPLAAAAAADPLLEGKMDTLDLELRSTGEWQEVISTAGVMETELLQELRPECPRGAWLGWARGACCCCK